MTVNKCLPSITHLTIHDVHQFQYRLLSDVEEVLLEKIRTKTEPLKKDTCWFKALKALKMYFPRWWTLYPPPLEKKNEKASHHASQNQQLHKHKGIHAKIIWRKKKTINLQKRTHSRPLTWASGKSGKTDGWRKWGARVQHNDVSGKKMQCVEIASTQRAPSIALAKGTDILMEITSFRPRPGTVNTIASC